MHTPWTDGSGTVEELAADAAWRGFETIAFTEHVRRDTGDWFSNLRHQVERVSPTRHA